MVFALRTCYFDDREIGERAVDAPGDFVWTAPNWYVPSARDGLPAVYRSFSHVLLATCVCACRNTTVL